MLGLIDIQKSFLQNKKVVQALAGVTVEVPKGSFVSVMGPSACGKSTLLKIAAGIEDADEGKIIFDGEDLGRKITKAQQRREGYVFQWHNLLEWRTSEGNVDLPLEMYGFKKDKADWKARADKCLGFVGLQDYKNFYPHELSGGMKQRVGIARALINDPDVFVLDQPFGALDAITRKRLARSFFEMVKKENKTVLMVTSDIDEVLMFSDRIYVLSNAPSTVKSIIDVDFTLDERTDELKRTDRFLDRKREMITLLQTIQADKSVIKLEG